MSITAQKVCIDAISLPRDSRAEIAERLLSSLDEKADAGAERAWKAENRRLGSRNQNRRPSSGAKR